MLYAALGGFIGTSLALAVDAFIGFRLGVLPTVLAVIGVSFLLLASLAMGSEVSLSVRSFDEELDQELARRAQLSQVAGRPLRAAACRACRGSSW